MELSEILSEHVYHISGFPVSDLVIMESVLNVLTVVYVFNLSRKIYSKYTHLTWKLKVFLTDNMHVAKDQLCSYKL